MNPHLKGERAECKLIFQTASMGPAPNYNAKSLFNERVTTDFEIPV
jgi:hypothetical protein